MGGFPCYYVLNYHGREGKPSTRLVESYANHSMARIEKKLRPRAHHRFYLLILDLKGSTSDPAGQPENSVNQISTWCPILAGHQSVMADSAGAGNITDRKRKPRRELHRVVADGSI